MQILPQNKYLLLITVLKKGTLLTEIERCGNRCEKNVQHFLANEKIWTQREHLLITKKKRIQHYLRTVILVILSKP